VSGNFFSGYFVNSNFSIPDNEKFELKTNHFENHEGTDFEETCEYIFNYFMKKTLRTIRIHHIKKIKINTSLKIFFPIVSQKMGVLR
jgi:hypothetical protein